MPLNLRGKPYILIIIVILLASSFSLYRSLTDNAYNNSFILESQGNENDMILESENSEIDTAKKEEYNYNEQVQNSLEESEEVIVYISGAVKSPGVYSLPYGSRIFQLIDEAEGASEDALLEYLNLAELIQDGEHIHVFREGDEIVEEQMSNFHSVTNDENKEQDGKVNINTADIAELETLPSIGPVRADNIVRHRESIGQFQRIDQIMEVNGIGTGIYDQINDLILVD